MFLEQQIFISDQHKDHVTLKTGARVLKIQLWCHTNKLY